MSVFPAIRIEGGLLGPDTLDQVLAGELPGQKPRDFGLDGRRTLTDEIASVFADARAQWEVFQHRLERLPESDLGTSVTRDAWMIPFLSLLGYELLYNPRAYEVDGATFAISHQAGEAEEAPPVHIVGARQELGRVAPTGRPRLAPHSLVQEYLNRSEQLWGIVSNGLTLRLLRDSTYIRRQAYVEFDLRQIFEEQRFADFRALYRLLHRSRLPRSAEDARDCWLERYHQHALEQGGRVRERLRDGVEECLRRLANGFLAHPANSRLRERISMGERRAASSEQRAVGNMSESPLVARHSLLAEEFYHQLLRLVYRFLFLLVSEDRGLISGESLYREHYGVTRLRRLLDRRGAYTEHDDIWCSLRVLWKVLGDEKLAAYLGAPALNGELFEPCDLDDCTIANRDFLEAFWHLAYYRETPSAPPRRVNYAALDVEELGSVYESLLDYHPVIEASGEQRAGSGGVSASGEQRAGSGWRFDLVFGSERKSTGSYYTPPELVAELIRSALDPVIADRLAAAERAATEIRRVASSEWRVVQEEIQQLVGKEDADPIVSRLGSLAESHGAGGRSLSHHERLSEGGALRTDQPNAASGNVGASEHRRGLGTARDEGISAIPEHRLGQSAGVGNLPPAGRADWDRESGTRPSPSSDARNPEQADGQPPAQSQTEVTRSITDLPALWASLPLATRHSLLARALAEHALLSIRSLDPACGSGHFLLAAARRLGKELAKIRTGEAEPAPERVREAIRDVVGHCIYGVDKNPLAVELCRVALWLEAHCAGKPLTFLDHRIRCGDSLVGVFDLAVLEKGVPDEAFAPATSDDKSAASLLKKRNRAERRDLEQGQLVLPFDPRSALSDLARQHAGLDAIPDDTPAHVREKKHRFDAARRSLLAARQLQACNLWTAAFFQSMRNRPTLEAEAITTQALVDHMAGRMHPQALAHAEALAVTQRFFHWPLEFPEVFAHGGFDVVLGNPPWERIKLQEQEFFATRDPEVAEAPTAAQRKRLIQKLEKDSPALWREYQEALRAAESTSRFLRGAGDYPFTGRGDINTYSVFAERVRRLLRAGGRAGIIVPTGIATDDTNKFFFGDLVEQNELASLYDFENRRGIFPEVHRSYKFCLLTLRNVGARHAVPLPSAEFAFFCHEASELSDPERRFMLTAEDFRLLNPNTRTAPIFRSRRDAELTKHIYRRVPVLINERAGSGEQRAVTGRAGSSEQRAEEHTTDELLAARQSPLAENELLAARHSLLAESNPWGVEFLAMFHMANDSGLFRTREELERAGYELKGNVFVKQPVGARHAALVHVQDAGSVGARHAALVHVQDAGSVGARHAVPLLPLYEAKMIHQFDHRFGDYRDHPEGSASTQLPEVSLERLADPDYQVLPRYWVAEDEVEARLRAKGWDRGWLLGWRDIARSTDERTVIAAVIPRMGVGDKYLLMLPTPPEQAALLVAALDSLPFDYCARQKVGGTSLKYFTMKQLPVLPPAAFDQPLPFEWEDHSPFAIRHSPTVADFIRPRVLELTYTAWDLKPFARDLWDSADDAGRQAILRQWEENQGTTANHSPFAIRHSPLPPFRYDPERRFQLRCELDALFFLLYLGTPKEWEKEATPELKALFPTPRDAVAYILDQFPIVRRKDEERFGVYRTKETILQRYDEMCR